MFINIKYTISEIQALADSFICCEFSYPPSCIKGTTQDDFLLNHLISLKTGHKLEHQLN